METENKTYCKSILRQCTQAEGKAGLIRKKEVQRKGYNFERNESQTEEEKGEERYFPSFPVWWKWDAVSLQARKDTSYNSCLLHLILLFPERSN